MASVRLDTFSEATLERLVKQRGQSRTEVVHEALIRLAEDEAQPSAYERLAPFIGCADSGGQQLSEQTGQRLRSLLEDKHRARRAG